MIRRTLMLLVATAMAVLLAGCGSSQKEDQGSGHGGSQREVDSSQQTSEPTTNETSVGRCADSGGTGQQEEASRSERSEVSNGRIAFSRTTSNPTGAATSSDIYVIDDDGSGRKQLFNHVNAPQLAWSPDGQRLAFVNIAGSHLYVINDDGSGPRRLLSDAPGSRDWAGPTWSPDSGKIAFSCPFAAQGAAHTDLCVINADGTGLKRIASNVAPEAYESDVAPSWGRE
jgi:WD40-like Beta Propeller Repeat